MFDLGTPWWEIIVRTAPVFGAMLLAIRCEEIDIAELDHAVPAKRRGLDAVKMAVQGVDGSISIGPRGTETIRIRRRFRQRRR